MPTLRRLAFCTALATLLVAGVAGAAIRSFQSPSGNIGCVAAKLQGSPASVRCDIAEQDNPVKPKPASCDLDYGTAYAVGRTGKAGRLCHGDTALNPTAPVLDYGDKIRFKGIVCTSRESGVRCENKSDHGFALSRASQTVF